VEKEVGSGVAEAGTQVKVRQEMSEHGDKLTSAMDQAVNFSAAEIALTSNV
jgi:hypothetical protein